jgi:hypothetical protein
MKTLRLTLAAALLVALALGAGGCFYANPRTTFGFNPWSGKWEFYDSKDNDIEVTDLRVDPESKMVSIAKLTVRNNASDVRLANVEQQHAQTEQLKAVTALINLATEKWSAVAAAAIPYALPGHTFSVQTPYGGGTISSTPGLPNGPAPPPAAGPPQPVGPPAPEGQ